MLFAFQRGRATPPSTHLVRDIIVCRKTNNRLRIAAILLLEAACRPPPTILLLEVVRAPPHTEEPFLPVRTTMTLVVPSWSPSWSLPPPMRAAAPDPRTGDAAPAPSECLSEAHYRLLRHAAVHTLSLLGHAPAAFKKRCFTRHRRRHSRGRWFPNEGAPGSRVDSAPGERFSVPRCRFLHHTAVFFLRRLTSGQTPRAISTPQSGAGADSEGADGRGV